ncbi:MAG: hypothetical protein FWE22_07250 [Firmicutes bacterium]|nr:hypothetical protein [Bacillota bacterium]
MQQRRLKTTLSGIAVLSFLLWIPMFVFIIIAAVLDPYFESALSVVMIVLVGIFFVTPIILMPIGDIIDRKKCGAEKWETEFRGELSYDKKVELTAYLNSKRYFSMEEKEGKVYFVLHQGSGATHWWTITFEHKNDFIKIECFWESIGGSKMRNGMYGLLGYILKRRNRKIISHILDMLDAPKDMRV